MSGGSIHYALLSVFDKTRIVEFARELQSLRVELLPTGGTARLLSQEGIKVEEVAEYTGYPEILEGRVKTLLCDSADCTKLIYRSSASYLGDEKNVVQN